MVVLGHILPYGTVAFAFAARQIAALVQVHEPVGSLLQLCTQLCTLMFQQFVLFLC